MGLSGIVKAMGKRCVDHAPPEAEDIHEAENPSYCMVVNAGDAASGLCRSCSTTQEAHGSLLVTAYCATTYFPSPLGWETRLLSTRPRLSENAPLIPTSPILTP
jgi:hypothetical protein